MVSSLRPLCFIIIVEQKFWWWRFIRFSLHNTLVNTVKTPRQFWKALFSYNNFVTGTQGPVSIQRPSFPGMGIPMLKIRRSWDRRIFNMGMPILVRHLYIETPLRFLRDEYESRINVNSISLVSLETLVIHKHSSLRLVDLLWKTL